MDIVKPVEKSNEKGIRYIGRFDFCEDGCPLFAWSCSTIQMNFRGKKISAKFESVGSNYFIVILDGNIINNCMDISEGGEFILAENLSEEGKHKIELQKRNEFNVGSVKFLGFNLYGGEVLPVEYKTSMKIEIIGDSITCGFGNEGKNDDEYFPVQDNGYMSYGAIAGRELNAETIVIGCSGYGMIQSYEGNEDETVPLRYNLISPQSSRLWDFSKWVPDVAIINLGTNDFCFGRIPDLDKFIKGYIEFIKVLHKNYKDTKIICSVGPLMDGEALRIIKECINEKIIKYFQGEKENYLYFLEFEPQVAERDGLGVSGHPSIKTHNKMAEKLKEKIKTIM